MFIKEVNPSIIRDSRGEETISVEIVSFEGRFSASAPSGKSKGEHETPAYNSRGIKRSLKMLRVLGKTLKHKNFLMRNLFGLGEFEKVLRKFESIHGKLGANVTYALESAILKASAKEKKKELWKFIRDSFKTKGKVKIPMPVGNCIGGGLHSSISGGERRPDFQEFLFIPNEKSFSKAVRKNLDVYEKAREELKKHEKTWFMKKNDENAWKTSLTNEEVLEIMYQIGKKYKVRIGIDAASSGFFEDGVYHYKNKKLIRDRKEQVDYIARLSEKYELFYIEDGLNEEDFLGFSVLLNETKKSKRKNKALIVGDDLTTTNVKRLRRAIQAGSINAVIIKPNQNGYLSEVAKVVDICKKYKIQMIFSHRSGETMDDVLADYAVGFGADFIKTGIIGRERLIKLRRIIEIERKRKRG